MSIWDDFLNKLGSPFNNNGQQSHNLRQPASEIGDSTNLAKIMQMMQGQQADAEHNAVRSLGMSGGVGGEATRAPLSLMEQLQQQLQGIQTHQTPLDQLKAQANNSVSAQYDPQINSINRAMGETKTRGEHNQGEARQMYGALAQDFANQLPGITDSMKQQQDAVSQRYEGAKQDLQGQYDKQKADQQSVLQQLGIQAAAPEAGAQAATDQSYFQNTASQDKNQITNQLAAQGQQDQQYTRDMSNNTKVAGENAAQDIGSQLESYLRQAQGQVSDLQGAKGSATQALLAQLQQQDSAGAEKSYQDQFNNIMQLNQFQRATTNDQNDLQMQMQKMMMDQQNSGSNNPFKGTSGMSGMSNFLSQQYPNDPGEASKLSSLVASVLQNPEVQMGKRGANGLSAGVPITNEYLIQLLRNAAQGQGENNPGNINNAIDALLAYKGQLR